MKEVSWDREERTARRDLKANLGLVEKLDLWELQERRENLESLDYLDTLEDKDLRALQVLMDSPELMERKEQGELLGRLAQEDNVDQRVPVVAVEQEDQPENQDKRATPAMMDHPARPERGDLQGLRDLSASLDPKDPMAQQEKMACLDTLDRGERRVSKERPDLQDLVGWLAHRDQLERQGPVEREDTQVPPAHLVSKVYLDRLAKKVEREIQVLWVFLAKWVPKV